MLVPVLMVLLSLAMLIVGIVSANERPPAVDVFNDAWASLMFRLLILLAFTLGIVNENGASELCEYGMVTIMSAFPFGLYDVGFVVDDATATDGVSSASMKSSSSMPHNFITFAKSNLPVLVTGAADDCVVFDCTAVVAIVDGGVAFFFAFGFFGFFAGFAGAACTVSTNAFGCELIDSGKFDCDDVVMIGFVESGTMTVLFGNIVIGVGFRKGSGVDRDVGINCVCCDGIAIN